MSNIDRGSNHAVTQAVWDTSKLDQLYLVHPAILDVVFQSIFLAKSYPAKSLMRSAFLPIGTGAFVTHSDYRSIAGDMHVYNRENKPFLEVEGLSLKIASELQESEDVQIFCQTTWGPDISLDLSEPERNNDHDSEQSATATTIDRQVDVGKAAPQFDSRNYIPTTFPGSRITHVALSDGSAISDGFGKGFTMVAFRQKEVVAAGDQSQVPIALARFEEAARKHSIPLKSLCLMNETHAFRIWDACLVLVRPDGVSAWRSDSLDKVHNA
ncbi:nonribosomal peptide synthetase 14 [Penicillium verhagenii]|nr:nonribosomal peptide synthetase 14 [Penicillium verhagenii]